MSAGFNKIEDANKYGVESFRYGQEGYNYLSDFLANTSEDKLRVNFFEIIKRSVSDTSESTSLKERIGVVVSELGEKESKGELTQLEKTIVKQARECFETFDDEDVIEYKEKRAAKRANEVEFGEFARAYMGQRKKDPSKLDNSMKIGIRVIQKAIGNVVDKDPITIAKPGHVWGFYVGENFDAFTKILNNLTVEVELAVANFMENDATDEQVENFKNLLKRYKEAFPTLGAQLKNKELILANIGKAEAVLMFDPENKNSKEAVLFDRIFAGGVDSIGKEHTKVFSKEKFFTKGVHFKNLNRLLKTPEGVAGIVMRMESYSAADREAVTKLVSRFVAVYINLHKADANEPERKEKTEKLQQGTRTIKQVYNRFKDAYPAEAKKTTPSSSVNPAAAGQSNPASIDVVLNAMAAKLNGCITSGANHIGVKSNPEAQVYTKRANYQHMLNLYLSENCGAIIRNKIATSGAVERVKLILVLERFRDVVFDDDKLTDAVKQKLGVHISMDIHKIDACESDAESGDDLSV